MKPNRYLVRYTTRLGDALCKVILAYTELGAVAALPFGSKLRGIELL